MNRLKKYITENGEFIGRGSDRKAYLIGNDVYKVTISCHYGNQNLKEKENIEHIQKYRGELDLLPNYQFVSNKVCKMEYVDLIASDCDEFQKWCYDKGRSEVITNFFKFCRANFSDFKHHHFMKEWKIAGIEDVYNNLGNFGYTNGYIKIIDFGI